MCCFCVCYHCCISITAVFCVTFFVVRSRESESTIEKLRQELELARKEKAVAVQAAKADKAMLEKFMIQQIEAQAANAKGRSKRR
jgi:hypothetical protein